MKKFLTLFFLSIVITCNSEQPTTEQPIDSKWYSNLKGLIPDCADPYVLKFNETYYLYGTGGDDGIKVYSSKDLVNWSKAQGATNGYALHRGVNVWGDYWFWAPEVYYINNKFYMFYSSQERIAVAESTTPLGPFVQSKEDIKPFHVDIPEIDSHLFIDDNGKKYLYFVRFTDGNEIWVAELNDDLHSIKEETLTHCLGVSQAWELSSTGEDALVKVNEGPFVLKHKGVYYLSYSANSYKNPNYGIGYATSESPFGPWKKNNKNPILISNDKIQGVGHHSFITTFSGSQYVIYHSHHSLNMVQPRKVCIDSYEFVPSSDGTPDVLKIDGPSTVPQKISK